MKEYIDSLRKSMRKPDHEDGLPYGLEETMPNKLSQAALWELASVYERGSVYE